MGLVAASFNIYKLFTVKEIPTASQTNEKKGLEKWTVSYIETENKDYDRVKLLHSIIQFYASILAFREAVNVYYFDNIFSEDFLSKLESKILSLYRFLLNTEVGDLKKFLNLEIYQLMKDKEFKRYSNFAYNTLLENAMRKSEQLTVQQQLCYYHLVYSRVLFTSVNDAFVITYSFPAVLEQSLSHTIKSEKNLLLYAIDNLNSRFYEKNHQRYYKLSIGRKNLLKPQTSIMKLILIKLKNIFSSPIT